VLFIVWDEDDHTANNRVLALVVSPRNHDSLLATIEDLLGVGRLGNAVQAKPMTDLTG
jgi:hypothetical protein